MTLATTVPVAAAESAAFAAPVRRDAAWLDAHWMPYTATASSRPTRA